MSGKQRNKPIDKQYSRSKMKKIAILLCLAAWLPAPGQILQVPMNPASLMTTEIAEINPYRCADNPAFLLLDPGQEALTLRSQFYQNEGAFRSFLTPDQVRILQQSASGKKHLSKTQVFSGAFGFQKEIRGGWDWIASKDITSGNPFLLGDSTSGDTHYDGIVMNAAYAQRIGRAFLLGTEIDYFVDEGLKKVSPKPRSQHREIQASVGLGWLFSRSLQFGLQSSLFDRSEEITYSEDKESMDRETILFKFRGFDYPQVLRKKTETRLSEHRGYTSGASITWSKAENAVIVAEGGWGQEKMTVKDNVLTPLPEGYWQAKRWHASLEAGWELNDQHGVRLHTALAERRLWARHPLYRVRLHKNREQTAESILAWRYAHSALSRFSFEGGWIRHKPEIQDYYSDIALQTKTDSWLLQIGWQQIWTTELCTAFRLGYENGRNSDPFYFAGSESDIYTDYRIADLLYLISDFSRQWGQLTVEITPKSGGTIALQATAMVTEPMGTTTFGGQDRLDIDINLIYTLPIQ